MQRNVQRPPGGKTRPVRMALWLVLMSLIVLSAVALAPALARNWAMLRLTRALTADVDARAVAAAGRAMRTAEQWGGTASGSRARAEWIEQFAAHAAGVEADRDTAQTLAEAAQALAGGEALADATVAALQKAAADGWTEARLLLAVQECGQAGACLNEVSLPPAETPAGAPVVVDGWRLVGYEATPTQLGTSPRLYSLTYWRAGESGNESFNAVDLALRRYRVGDVWAIVQEQDNLLLNGDFTWSTFSDTAPWGYSRMFCTSNNQAACNAGLFEVTEQRTLHVSRLDGQPLLYQYVTVERGDYLLLGRIQGRAGFIGFRELQPDGSNRFTTARGVCDCCPVEPVSVLVEVEWSEDGYVYLGLVEDSTISAVDQAVAEFDDLALIELPPLPEPP